MIGLCLMSRQQRAAAASLLSRRAGRGRGSLGRPVSPGCVDNLELTPAVVKARAARGVDRPVIHGDSAIQIGVRDSKTELDRFRET